MEENFDLENSIDDVFVQKNDSTFREEDKDKKEFDQKKENKKEIRRLVEELENTDITKINVFSHENKRKSINLDKELNVINDKQEKKEKGPISLEFDDPNFTDFLNTLDDTTPVQNFSIDNKLSYKEKQKHSFLKAYENLYKFRLIYKKTYEILKDTYDDYRNLYDERGNGFVVDGRDCLNISYVIALNNPEITEREYASLLLNLYTTFKKNYSKDETNLPSYCSYVETFLKDDVKEKLKNFANNIDISKAEGPIEIGRLTKSKELALSLANGVVSEKTVNFASTILKNEIGVNLDTLNEYTASRHLTKYLKNVLPTVANYFLFCDDVLKDYNFIDTSNVLGAQKIITFATQSQSMALKHGEFDMFLSKDPDNLDTYKESDNKIFKSAQTISSIDDTIKQYNINVRDLSESTIGVENAIENPLTAKFYNMKSNVATALGKSEGIVKLPLEENTYKFTRRLQNENKLSAKDKYELYEYINSSESYFEELLVANTNEYKTASKFGLTWKSLIFINGRSLEEISRSLPEVTVNYNNKNHTYRGDCIAVKVLLDSLINKHDQVDFARLHSSENKIEVCVRPLFGDFDQEKYEQAYKKTGLAGLFSRAVPNINDLQQANFEARKVSYSDTKQVINNQLVKKIMSYTPNIVQEKGRKLDDSVIEYQKTKLKEKGYKEKEIEQLVNSHLNKVETIDLKLDKNNEKVDEKNYDILNEPKENNVEVKGEKEIVKELVKENVINNEVKDNTIEVNKENNINNDIKENVQDENNIINNIEDNNITNDNIINENNISKDNIINQNNINDNNVINEEKIDNNVINKNNNQNNIEVINTDINTNQVEAPLVDLKTDNALYKEEDINNPNALYSFDKLIQGLDPKYGLDSVIENFTNTIDQNDDVNMFDPNEIKVFKNKAALNKAYENLSKLNEIHKVIKKNLLNIDRDRFYNLDANNGTGRNFDSRDVHTLSYIYAIENPNMTVKEYAEVVSSLYLAFTHDYSKDEANKDAYLTYIKGIVTDDIKERVKEHLKTLEQMPEDNEFNINKKKGLVNAAKSVISDNYDMNNISNVTYVLNNQLGIKVTKYHEYNIDKHLKQYIERVKDPVLKMFNYCDTFANNFNKLDMNSIADNEKVLIYILQGQAKYKKHDEFDDLILPQAKTLEEIKHKDNVLYRDQLFESNVQKDMRKLDLSIQTLSTATIGLDGIVGDVDQERTYGKRAVVQDTISRSEKPNLDLLLDEKIYKYAKVGQKFDSNRLSAEEGKDYDRYLTAIEQMFDSTVCANTNEYRTGNKFNLTWLDLFYIDGKPIKEMIPSYQKLTEMDQRRGYSIKEGNYGCHLLIKALVTDPKRINFVRLHSTDTKLQVEIRDVNPLYDQNLYVESNPKVAWYRKLFGMGAVDLAKTYKKQWDISKSDKSKLYAKINSNMFTKLVTKKPKLVQKYSSTKLSKESLNVQKEMLQEKENMTLNEAKEFIKGHKQGPYVNDSDVVDNRKPSKGNELH